MCIPDTHPLIVLSFHERIYILTKDLKQLMADLEATDDELAVIQRYKDALAAKGEVCCDPWSDSNPVILTYFEVCARIGRARKSGESGQRGRT